jgi:hypothetical protein
MVADADVVFQVELPAIQQWQFSSEQAAPISVPALEAYRLDLKWDGFIQTQAALSAWMPATRALVLPTSST